MHTHPSHWHPHPALRSNRIGRSYYPINSTATTLILFQFPPHHKQPLPIAQTGRRPRQLLQPSPPLQSLHPPPSRQHNMDLQPIPHLNVPLSSARERVDHELQNMPQGEVCRVGRPQGRNLVLKVNLVVEGGLVWVSTEKRGRTWLSRKGWTRAEAAPAERQASRS